MAEPSKTRVLELNSGLGMFAAKKQETVLEAKIRALNVARYRFFAMCQVRLRNGMEPPKK